MGLVYFESALIHTTLLIKGIATRDPMISILTTYQHAFKLLNKSFIAILPFAIVYVAIDLSLDALLTFSVPEIDPSITNNLKVFAYPIVTALFSILLFSCIIYGIYIKQHNLPFHYAPICLTACKQFWKVVASLIILLLPIIMMSLALNFISGIFETLGTSDEQEINLMAVVMMILLGLFCLATIAWLLICIYFYIAPLLIVAKNETVLNSLKHSWHLVRGHWFRTFAILFLLVLVTALLKILLYLFLGPLSDVIISVVILPLNAALMITHYDNLQNP